MEKLLRAIREKTTQPIYVVSGTDNYLLFYIKQLFKEHIVSGEDSALDVSVYNMVDTPIDVAIQEANGFPFFAQKKVVIMDNAYFLSADKTKSIEHDTTTLEEYMTYPNDLSVLVIVVPATLDKRKKIVKSLMQCAEHIDASELDEKGLKQFVNNALKQKGFTIDSDALTLLVTKTNGHLGVMMSELEKLCVVDTVKQTITVNLIEQFVPNSLENNVFALSNYIEQKALDKALQAFQELLLQGEDAIKLLAILMSQFRLNIQVCLLLKEGYQQHDIAKYLSQHPFRVQQAIKQVKGYQLEQLERIYTLLIETDLKLKTSVTNKNLLMELAIIKIIRGH